MDKNDTFCTTHQIPFGFHTCRAPNGIVVHRTCFSLYVNACVNMSLIVPSCACGSGVVGIHAFMPCCCLHKMLSFHVLVAEHFSTGETSMHPLFSLPVLPQLGTPLKGTSLTILDRRKPTRK